jgi:hypothetical protein
MNVALLAPQGCPLCTDSYMVAEQSSFSDMFCRSGPVQGTMFCSDCGVKVRGLGYCVQLVCKVRPMVRDFNVRDWGAQDAESEVGRALVINNTVVCSGAQQDFDRKGASELCRRKRCVRCNMLSRCR